MRTDQLKSIDHYEAALGAAIQAWSPGQRVALAATMAERWLPAYESFSAAEEWGDAASLSRTLKAVWDHALGRPLAPADRARLVAQLDDCTPHVDDFDAPEALAACAILREALECCKSGDNTVAAVRAALSGFEAAVTDWLFEPDEQPRLWKQVAARRELKKQLRVVEEIAGWKRLDQRTVEAFRERLRGSEFVGEPSAPSEVPACSAGITNQQAFEQYRSMMELDLRTASPLDLPGVAFAIMRIGVWSGRYSRRRQTLDGSYGRLADAAGARAVVARLRARDAAETGVPDWDADSRMMIEMTLSHGHAGIDARSPQAPHGYGPSLRCLWLEGKRSGGTDAAGWEAVVAWARHRPAAWAAEDRRKKNGQAYATPALGPHLARELTWTTSADVECPWAVGVDGTRWRVRVNHFPDDYMYTLLVGDAEVGSFHDWPETWRRE